MNYSDITLVLGVDAHHLKELRLVWPSWMQFKPELREMPAVVFYDDEEVQPADGGFLHEHPNLRWVPWNLANARNQREKMLTGFIHIPAREVQTPWYLKLDTDVLATGSGDWIKPEWFLPDANGEPPVFISSKWGYSKPRYVMDLLDDWADGVPALAVNPRLNLPYSSAGDSVNHKRIISWIFYGLTEWAREVVKWLDPDGRLPCPSQDSYMSYCARRLKKRTVRERMAKYHWAHKRVQVSALEKRETAAVAHAPQTSPAPRGVIYYNTGTSCAVRLLVSLSSLRRHYEGPVTILSEGEESHPFCRKIGAALNAAVLEWDCGVASGANRVFLVKTVFNTITPYQTTVALDSDTLVMGGIEELFEQAEDATFCVAQIGDWKSQGRKISKRINAWKSLMPGWMEGAIAFGPAVNIGVMAFTKEAPIYRDWHRLALPGRETFIPDEVCCQVMLHRYPHRILSGVWNHSCIHDRRPLDNTRIIHYHGRKHCRIGLPHHGDKWMAVFDDVMVRNVAGVTEWQPAGDRMLRKFQRYNKPIINQC